MSDPTAAPAAGDPAAQPATTTAAPAVEATAPASAPAAAATTTAPTAAPSTLLTADDAPADPAATTEGQPAAEGEGEKKPANDADAHAPEEYAAFELPEGATLDEEFATAFKPLAKELDLPQGKANALAKLAHQESQRLGTKFVSELQRTVDENAKAWETAVKADPELGGAQHAEVMGTAKRALDAFASPAFKQFLNESRLGSNPEMIRLLFKAGKAISQDGAVTGRTTTGSKTDADVFYGKTA